MAYKPTDTSRFDRAKELARQIVEESNQGDGFTLVLMGEPPRVVVATPVFEAADFLEEIQAVKQPHSGADLPATLAAIDEVLQNARRDHPKLTQQEVYFLSDLGRNSWAPQFAAPGAPTVSFPKQASRRTGDAGRDRPGPNRQ